MVWKKVGQLSLLDDSYLFLFLVTLALPVSSQFLQQRLGLLQILRVKPLGEPVVDLGQQLVSFGPLALLLPQPTQTHHRP
jgi:hypothetical protein